MKGQVGGAFGCQILLADLLGGGEVSRFPDLEFCTGKTSSTPGHKSEPAAGPATRAIFPFFELGVGEPAKEASISDEDGAR